MTNLQSYSKWLPLSFLVFANLAPLFGVLLAGWSASVIIFLYWSENIVIGIYNVLKMTFARKERPSGKSGRVVSILFFCVHYGAFCAAHGYFVFNFFGIGETSGLIANDPGPIYPAFIQTLLSFIHKVWVSMPDGVTWPFIALFVSHGVSFVYNYLIAGEYKAATAENLMHQPYNRIVVMHIVIITAAIFITEFNSPLPMLIILVIIKTAMDIKLHNKEHGMYLFGSTDKQ